MYKLLDLFAGAGGLSKGFEMTGQFEVVGVSENNKWASETYQQNHPGVKNYDDVKRLPYQQIKNECGKIDVIIGGPPCQGFSNANRQKRQLINGSNELVKAYVKAIKELSPDIFVMENVKTIGSDKHHFCLTNADGESVRELGVTIENKEFILYSGDFPEFIREHVKEVTILDDKKLYFLKNVLKKKNKLEKLFDKNANVNILRNIIEILGQCAVDNEMLNREIHDVGSILGEILENKTIPADDCIKINKFLDLQRYCLGIKELEEKDVIFETNVRKNDIVISVHEYTVIDYIKRSFQELGYKIEANGVINAAEFGVPQTRERYIMIGIRNEIYDDSIELKLPNALITDENEYVTVQEAIDDLRTYKVSTTSMDEVVLRDRENICDTFYKSIVFNQTNNEIYNHVCTASTKKAKERFELIGEGKNFHDLPDEYKDTYENPSRTQNTIYKKLVYDKPSDTVVNVRKSMWIHPKLNRAISAREAARLQSFPDDYCFKGTKDAVYQQIGNAVPPILGRAVAEKVLELLKCEEEYDKLSDIYERMNR